MQDADEGEVSLTTTRRRHAAHKPRSARRRALEVAAVFMLIGVCLGIASVGNAANSQTTRTSISLSLWTTTQSLGPFVTPQPAVTSTDANGVLHIAQSDLVFSPVDTTLGARSLSVALLPTTDLLMSVDAAHGTASVNGEFSLQFTDAQANTTCQIDHITVNATTDPPGASLYSPSTGAATAIDAAPSLPAATSCGDMGTAINDGLGLPITPAPPQPTATPSSTAPQTAPVPRIEVHLTVTPPLQPSTTTTTKAPAAIAPVSGPSGHPHIADAKPATVQAVAPRVHHTAHVHSSHSSAKTTTKKTTAKDKPKFATVGNGVAIGSVPDPSLAALMTPLAAPPSHPAANGPLGIAPAASKRADTPSRDGLVVVLVLGTLGLGVALWLIRSDMRSLVPARAPQRVRAGRVARPGARAH